MTCHNCKTLAQKFGWFISGSERIQRYRCKQCGKTFGDIPERPLDSLRTAPDDAARVIHLLCEGVGVRAASRLTGMTHNTVMRILETAGPKCARLLDLNVRNVRANYVQVDEMWCYVNRKQKHAADSTFEMGDQYVWLAMDAETKLLIAYHVGKRDGDGAHRLMRELRDRVNSSFQLSTDGFVPYRHAVPGEFHDEHTVHFAQLVKVYATAPLYPNTFKVNAQFSIRTSGRYSPPKCSGAKKIPVMGNPEWKKISTSHIERQNLNMRLFNRRLTRLTMGFSKKLANLKHSVALHIAHHNFCRVHRTIGETPAMAAGLTDHKWTIAELLKA